MSIDIETYSSVPIQKAGMYKYVESPDFEVMLFAYSLDGALVQVIDLTQPGAEIPQDVRCLLLSADCTKHAANAAFEWACLSKALGLSRAEAIQWLPQWEDTLMHALYCGYPGSLDAAGEALGLPTDKRKLAAGKALIKYFCMPCPPTKNNGQRTRNRPHHDPDKWTLFKEYNRQDVITEMAVDRKLEGFRPPTDIQRQWVEDQIINSNGVAVDEDLVAGAIWCGDKVAAELREEATRITGLVNPNSIPQLKKWLGAETGDEAEDLRKGTVQAMLDAGLASDAATRMLEIRQELGKTSTKKYNAIETCMCADGRVRGLMQFYGANRTGREAGRLVQVQNLPRTYIKDTDLARQLVRERNIDGLQLCYGSVPGTLSQLVRTALVAAPGKILIDADFSSIEARVIAWLAGEEWALEVFRGDGRIYEATAAQMFGVPVERIARGNPEYAYRQKGKVATLALGYQGGPGALIAMGALNSGIAEEELPDIVARWRTANGRIVQLWRDVEAAAINAVCYGMTGAVGPGGCVRIQREQDAENGLDFMTIELPSGRKLFYAHPRLTQNRFGRNSLCYQGMDQTTKKWMEVETYGGKLTENLTQAVARDLLFHAMGAIGADKIIFDVHDEVVLEVESNSLEETLAIMAQPVPWAPGLPMCADGWAGKFYTKE